MGVRSAALLPPVHAHHALLDAPAADLAVDWIIAIVHDGTARIASGNDSHDVNAWDAVLVVPGTVVGIEPNGQVAFTFLAVDGDWLDHILFWHRPGATGDDARHRHWALPIWREPPIRHGEVHPAHREVLPGCLEQLVRLSSPGARLRGAIQVHQLVWTVLAAVAIPLDLDRPARRGESVVGVVALRPELRQAWDSLRERPAERWTLARLAAEAHLSRSQFSRLFTRAFGKAPIQYLTTVRVQVLAHLVRTTMLPVAECARQVGWTNASYATRQFRRITGMTPRQYRVLPAPGQGFARPR